MLCWVRMQYMKEGLLVMASNEVGKELRLTVILESEEKPAYKSPGYRLWAKECRINSEIGNEKLEKD